MHCLLFPQVFLTLLLAWLSYFLCLWRIFRACISKIMFRHSLLITIVEKIFFNCTSFDNINSFDALIQRYWIFVVHNVNRCLQHLFFTPNRLFTFSAIQFFIYREFLEKCITEYMGFYKTRLIWRLFSSFYLTAINTD